MEKSGIPFDALNETAAAYGLNIGSAARLDGGHINESFAVITDDGKYLFQRLNTAVFRDPFAVMGNIEKICGYAEKRAETRILRYLRALDGKNYTVLGNGDFYRVCRLYDAVSGSGADLGAVYTTGFGFGTFLATFAGMDAAELCETIPDFHNTKKRICDFRAALESADGARREECRGDIEYILGGAEYYSEKLNLPLRVTHNDTKGDNLLLDGETRELVCIIDLDTVMPGLAINDFGDAVRSTVCACAEDERDTGKIKVDIDRFDALTRGYIGAAGGILTAAERDALVRGALTMTYECGLRFLADYLDGDRYFGISYPTQNLVRARSQAALLRSLTAEYDKLCAVVKRYE